MGCTQFYESANCISGFMVRCVSVYRHYALWPVGKWAPVHAIFLSGPYHLFHRAIDTPVISILISLETA